MRTSTAHTSQVQPLSPLCLSEEKDLADKVASTLAEDFPKGEIKRIALIAPPDADETMFDWTTAKRGRYWNYPPYGIGLLASLLRDQGLDVDILNLNNTILKESAHNSGSDDFSFQGTLESALRDFLEDLKPDLIGFTCMFAQTHRALLDTIEVTRTLCPDTPFCVGGVHVTNSYTDLNTRATFLEDMTDISYLFLYECDLAFPTFVNVVTGSAGLEELSQVVMAHEDGYFEFTKRSQPTGEILDTIPAHDLMTPTELGTYGKIGSFYCLKPPGTHFTTSLSNRGCRGSCTFCSVRSFNGVGVRGRSVQSVIDELKMLQDEFQIGHVMWLDDDFLYNHARSLELFNEMVKQDVRLSWDCTNGVLASSCTEELMTAAAAAGCVGLNIGMESGNPDILKKIKKPGAVKTFLKAAETLRKIEQINARVFLMIGFPHETFSQIYDTISVAEEMALDWYNVTILQPLPNTPIYEEMVQQGLLSDTVEFEEIRYNSGVYGKHRKKAEKNRDLLSSDFKNAFQANDLNHIPDRKQLDDIWAYMNYHLNFAPMAEENRDIKVQQKLAYVQNIVELVAPGNAFAHYFCGLLKKRISGHAQDDIADHLDAFLKESPYWQARFSDFSIQTQSLRS